MQLTTLSQSSLQDYIDCAKRFELRYIEQLSYPAVESEPTLENEKHQKEGEYFHRLVQQYILGIPVEQISKLANTDNLKRWWENFQHSENLTGLTPLRSASGVLRKDLSGLYPEAILSAPLGNYRLMAKFDLLAIDNNKATIYDWKTYRKRPRNEFLAGRMQTRVYRALLAHAGAHLNNGQPFAPEQIEMIYWFSDFPDEPARFNYTPAQYKRDWDTLVKLAEKLHSASTYPLTDDTTKCSYCPYRSYCDRGVRAGTMDDAEAEMETEELFDVNFEQIGEIQL